MEIGLADAVDAVRKELMEAASRGEGQPLSFEVGPIEMEFEIELRAEAKGGAKFKAWVVSAETEAGVSRGRTHRVAFTLTPRTGDNSSLVVSNTNGRPVARENVADRIED
ncbi:trypco2 family protein [Kitasatospora sp. NPDC051914]|uniref:trypco2 family protein n=1 Tax=Kitasatospora sp. NPDC051914 TaxID=3154945 RepID=UPI003419FB53